MTTIPSSMQSDLQVAVAGGGEAAVVGAPDIGQSTLCSREVPEGTSGGVDVPIEATTRTGTMGMGSVRSVPIRRGGPLLDGLDIGLNALKNGGAATHVPYMKEAAGVLLQIVNVIQAVRDNQDAFIRLVDQAGRILLSIARSVQPPREITDDMKSTLERIKNIVLEIKSISDGKTTRGRFRRFLGYGSDKVEIGRLRDELNVAVQIFGVDVAVMNNADIHELNRYVGQLVDQYPRGSRAGAADSPSSPRPSVTPPPLRAPSSGDCSPLPSIEISDVTIHDGAFNDISAHGDASNIGEGTQYIYGLNVIAGADGDVHLNSPTTHSGSRSRKSSRSPSPSFNPSTSDPRQSARASPSPSVVVLPEEHDTMHQPLQDPPLSSSPPQNVPAPPIPKAGSASFSGISINNGALNHVRSSVKMTNKGQGTQTFFGPNVATNVRGNVSMNSGNVTTTTISNSNNDYSTNYINHRNTRRPRRV